MRSSLLIPSSPRRRGPSRRAALNWVPACAGMIGLILVGCGASETDTPAAPEAPKVVAETSVPPIPPMPKSLTLEDIDFNAYSKDLAKFTGLKDGQSRGEAVDNVRLYFAPERGNTMVKTTQSKFEREDGAVLLFGVSGLPDDSVKAQEIYLIMSGEKGAQKLGAYGMRIKCYRGENTTEWTTELCP